MQIQEGVHRHSIPRLPVTTRLNMLRHSPIHRPPEDFQGNSPHPRQFASSSAGYVCVYIYIHICDDNVCIHILYIYVCVHINKMVGHWSESKYFDESCKDWPRSPTTIGRTGGSLRLLNRGKRVRSTNAGLCGAMRGRGYDVHSQCSYAGLCSAMRGYAGRWKFMPPYCLQWHIIPYDMIVLHV